MIDGFVFLGLLGIISILFIIWSAVDEPNPYFSSVILSIVVALAILFTNAGQIIRDTTWWMTVLYVTGYCITGCIYSIIIRWPLYLNGLLRRLKAAKKDMLQKRNIKEILAGENAPFKEWQGIVHRIGYPSGLYLTDSGDLVPPQYHENKARLMTWAILWPWNILWVLVRKPIVWIFEELLNLHILKSICQAISNWTFKDFK
jgi:hypothetical protein